MQSVNSGRWLYVGFTGPASPTAVTYGAVSILSEISPSNYGAGYATAFGTGIAVIRATTAVCVAVVQGYVVTSAGNAGTLQMQFRTNNADNSATVKAGSFLSVTKIG